jgi:hypothetical protein
MKLPPPTDSPVRARLRAGLRALWKLRVLAQALAIGGLLACPAPAAGYQQGWERRLEALASAPRAELPAAQAALAEVLGGAAPMPLAKRLAGAGPELRGRVAACFDARPEHLRLAAWLTERPEAAAAELGRAALDAALDGWRQELDRAPLAAGSLRQRWDELERTTPYVRWRSAGTGPLSDVLERLVRVCDPPVPVVLDPELVRAGRTLERPLGLGSWRSFLEELALETGAVWNAVTSAPGAPLEPRPIAFLWLRPENRDDRLTPRQHLAEWVRVAVSLGPELDRRAAARALAASGWPAGLRLLGHLALEGDAPAAEGLALAAARGSVARACHDPAVQAAWLARALASVGDLGAAPWVRALGELGRRAPDGGDRLPEWVERTAAAAGRERRLRFQVLARWGAWSPELEALLREEWAAPALDAGDAERVALAVEVWRACAPVDAQPPRLVAAAELWQLVRFDAEACGRLGRGLGASGVRPPAPWRDPDALPTPFGARARAGVLAWWLMLGELETARAHLRGFEFDARKPTHLAALWSSLGRVGRGDALANVPELLRSVDRAALAASDRERMEDLEVALGLAPDWGHAERMARWDPLLPGDLALHACLAAGSDGEVARGRLMSTARTAFERGGEDPDGLISGAFDLAVSELFAAGLDREATTLLRGLGGLARRHANTPLAEAVLDPDFALPPGLPNRDLEAEELRLSP